MVPNLLQWTAQTATLAYIAQEVSKVDPKDRSGCCVFCHHYVLDALHDKHCAWLQARDFMGE